MRRSLACISRYLYQPCYSNERRNNNPDEETKEEPQIITFNLDPYTMILKDINDQQEWIKDFMKQMKPKKKINKAQLSKDIFEIDFMCD